MARLMVVEDDVTIGGHLESSLRAHGHEVVWKRIGCGAIQAADTGEFGLVLAGPGSSRPGRGRGVSPAA
jgi:DNA-binding response OmpR family regulator